MPTQHGVIQELFLKNGILNQDLTVNEAKIKPTLINSKKGLKQYLSIQRSVNITNISKDILFQEMFSNFYGLDRNRDTVWKNKYYTLLEDSKKRSLSFREVLELLYKQTNTIEASFSSKLLATLDPKLPVIDKWVLINLSLYKEYQEISRIKDVSVRIDNTDELYKKIIDMFEEFIQTKGAQSIFARFAREYPYTNVSKTSSITKVKILDLILWQIRNRPIS